MATETTRGQTTSRRPRSRDIFGPGIIAGLSGAALMALFAMIVSAAQGGAFFGPLKLISAVFLGSSAVTLGVGAVVLGIVIHLLVGSFWGVVYAAYLPRGVRLGTEIGVSLLYGIGIFLVMTFLILPWANPVMFGAIDRWWFLVYHLVFGVSLTLVLPVRRSLTVPASRAHAAA